MSIGNLKDNGNKGNNFPYQLSVLQLLDQIAQSTTTPCCPTAATEATLQQVLAAVQSGSLFFNNLVIDQGGVGCPANCPTYSEVKVWNGVGFTTTYYNASGAVVVPVGPLVYVNPQYVLNDIYLQLIAINANTTNTPVTLTPTIVRATGVGTIGAGAKSISVYNAGAADGTVLTVTVKPGESYTWSTSLKGETLAAVAYNATGTELVITTL